uniref:Uncharacterized protein n=1 Tax=Arundo donax TaxID=35708 RepID=A0A0A8ZEL6_ARUDO
MRTISSTRQRSPPLNTPCHPRAPSSQGGQHH